MSYVSLMYITDLIAIIPLNSSFHWLFLNFNTGPLVFLSKLLTWDTWKASMCFLNVSRDRPWHVLQETNTTQLSLNLYQFTLSVPPTKRSIFLVCRRLEGNSYVRNVDLSTLHSLYYSTYSLLSLHKSVFQLLNIVCRCRRRDKWKYSWTSILFYLFSWNEINLFVH